MIARRQERREGREGRHRRKEIGKRGEERRVKERGIGGLEGMGGK